MAGFGLDTARISALAAQARARVPAPSSIQRAAAARRMAVARRSAPVLRTALSKAPVSGPTPAAWQVNPTALRQLIAAAQKAHVSGLGYLGISPEAGQVGGAIGSKAGAAGATSLATYLGAGSVAGPIGIAAGVVIAVAVSLLTKHYFNVPQANALCAQEKNMVQKYLQIQGYVAGRALGLSTMQQVFHGMVGYGLFPMNNKRFCFHEGCIDCVGDGTWVDATLHSCSQGNCMDNAFAQYQQQRANIPSGTPDAIYFVDSIYLPLNASGKPPWITSAASANPQVHQMLYDLADAYLAQNAQGTTPYVEYPQQQVQAAAVSGAEASPTGPITGPGAPAGGSPAGGTSSATTAGAGTGSPSGVATSALPAGWTQVGTDPATGAPIVQQQGNAQLYEYANGQLTPYTPTATTASGVATTGGLNANTVGLIQSMLAQGASQSQAYASALQSLASQGVNTQSPAVQQQVAQAVQNPQGAMSAITANQAGMSTPEMLLMVAVIGGVLFFGKDALKLHPGKKHHTGHAS